MNSTKIGVLNLPLSSWLLKNGGEKTWFIGSSYHAHSMKRKALRRNDSTFHLENQPQLIGSGLLERCVENSSVTS